MRRAASEPAILRTLLCRLSLSSALAAVGCSSSQHPPAAPDSGDVAESGTATRFDLAIRHTRLFAATGDAVIPDASLFVRNGTIAAVVAGDAPPAIGALEIDGTGTTTLPGLVDAHVHVSGDGVDAVLDSALASGVVAVRDLAGDPGVLLPLRDGIERGARRGPRLRASGPVFTAPGGHPVGLFQKLGIPSASIAAMTRQVASSADALQEVDDLAAASPRIDWIKAALTGNGTAQIEPRLAVDVLAAVVGEAHRSGLPVAVHTEGPIDVADAISAGIGAGDTIEHTASESLDAQTAAQVATSGATFVATMVLSGVTDPPVALSAANLIAYFQAMRAARVPVVAGTDSACATSNCYLWSVYPGWPIAGSSLVDELDLMVTAGMAPADALLAATRDGARLLGLTDAGTIELTRRADLLVVRGDPTQHVDDLRNVVAVIQRGAIVVDNR
jgi:enamidase